MDKLNIFRRRQILRLNTTLSQHIPYGAIILHVLTGNIAFSSKIFFLYIVVGHFCCKVLRCNGKRRQKISQWAAVLYAKPLFHLLCRITAKQRLIAFRANTAESCVIYTALINVLRKPLFRFSQSAACLCALNQRNAFFDQFLLAGLNSEIALCKCNFFFFRIAVLRNQITGIARQHIVFDCSLCSIADSYHFRDLTKMILHCYPACFTGFDSTNDCFRKVLPSFISEERHQIACIPKFNTCFLIAMYYKIKPFFDLTDSPFIHYPSSSVFSISFFALSEIPLIFTLYYSK